MKHYMSDFDFGEYHRLAQLSPAHLLHELLLKNVEIQRQWLMPSMRPAAAVLTCMNHNYRLMSMFGPLPFLLDNLRKPMGTLTALARQGMELAIAAHRVKAALWIPDFAHNLYHPDDISGHIATEDRVQDIIDLQDLEWECLIHSSVVKAQLEAGNLILARLRLDKDSHFLHLEEVITKSGRFQGQYVYRHYVTLGQVSDLESISLEESTPDSVLGYLILRNQVVAPFARYCGVPALGCFLTCMDPRINYFGPGSILGKLSMLIANLRVPGASFPASCRDALVYHGLNGVRILAWIPHDTTCAMANLWATGQADDIHHLRDHFSDRELHWESIRHHPGIQARVSDGSLLVARLDLNLHTGQLKLVSYDYAGPGRELLKAWENQA